MADLLVKFSDQKNLNSLRGLNKEMDKINNLVNQQDSLSSLGRMIIPDVIDEYNKTFNRQEDDDIFRWRMAKWHYDRKNYGYAFVNLVEAALSYCCYMLGRNDVWDRDLRDHIRDIMFKASNQKEMNEDTEEMYETLKGEMQQADVDFASFVERYSFTNRDRNNIAHELDHGMRKYETEMSDLDKAIKYFDKVIRDRNRRKKLLSIPLFINFSNHPSSGWGEDQLLAAKALGEVVDIPFPMVKPDATPEEIDKLASECVESILNRGNGRPLVVHVMGEMTLSHTVVMLLHGYVNVSCVASTTERKVTEVDGKKVSEFHFVQFRKY